MDSCSVQITLSTSARGHCWEPSASGNWRALTLEHGLGGPARHEPRILGAAGAWAEPDTASHCSQEAPRGLQPSFNGKDTPLLNKTGPGHKLKHKPAVTYTLSLVVCSMVWLWVNSMSGHNVRDVKRPQTLPARWTRKELGLGFCTLPPQSSGSAQRGFEPPSPCFHAVPPCMQHTLPDRWSVFQTHQTGKRQPTKEQCLYRRRACGGVHSAVQLWARATQHRFGQFDIWSQGQEDQLLLNKRLPRQMSWVSEKSSTNFNEHVWNVE